MQSSWGSLGDHIRRLIQTAAPRSDQEASATALLPFPGSSVQHWQALMQKSSSDKAMGQRLSWLVLTMASLNRLYMGPSAAKVPSGFLNEVQRSCVAALGKDVDLLFRDVAGPMPAVDWEATMKATAVSYTGEEVYPAEPLCLERLAPALPSATQGGAIDVLEVVDDSLRHLLEDPRRLLRRKEERSEMPSRPPRVWASTAEWIDIAKVLMARNLAGFVPRSQVACVDGIVPLCGAFGVGKDGNPRGVGNQRLVINMPFTNKLLRDLDGDMAQLPQTNTWQIIMLDSTEVLLVSSEDLKCAFYLFRLPETWMPFLCFSPVVKRGDLGIPGDCTEVGHVALKVVPMGATFATGVIQHVHRRLGRLAGLEARRELRRDRPALQSPQVVHWSQETAKIDQPLLRLWEAYLDNMDMFEVATEQDLKRWLHSTSGDQQAMRDQYQDFNVPTSDGKSLRRVQDGKILGSVLVEGVRVRPPAEAIAKLVHLTLATIEKPRVTKRWMQVLAGRWVRCMQHEVSSMCIFNDLWRDLVRWPRSQRVPSRVAEELLMAVCLVPRMYCDLRLPVSPLVTVADASSRGGAFSVSTGLSQSGRRALSHWLEGGTGRADNELLLLSLFDGIGGARRALELCRVGVACYAASETASAAKRVTRYSWPSPVDLGDVKNITGATVHQLLLKYPTVTKILLVGGAPCQGLSGVNRRRTGLKHPESTLFHEIPRIVKEIRALEVTVELEFFVENVASMTAATRLEISECLGCSPVRLCNSAFSHARRPRLYWCSFCNWIQWSCETRWRGGVLELLPEACTGPTSRWKKPGVAWKRSSALARLPTFLRATPRSQEPREACGRHKASAQALQAWAAEEFRYAPYQYEPAFLLWENGCARSPSANERELLLDFAPYHTMTALPTRARKEAVKSLEILRCQLLGDSFACLPVAFLLQHWLVAVEFMPRLLSTGEMRDDALPRSATDLSCNEQARLLAQGHISGSDPRGSDVRLDSGDLLAPKSWPRKPIDAGRWFWKSIWSTLWKKPDHITLLECLAAHMALAWRLGHHREIRHRFLHLVDNQSSLAVMAKHRSSSTALNRICRRSSALILASGVRRALAYCSTDNNPADEGSRSADQP